MTDTRESSMSSANDKASMVIREAANDWAARLAAPDLAHAEKVEFAAWLRASPVHIREYLNAEAVRLTVMMALQNDTTDVQTLLCQPQTNVVEWEAAPSSGASEFKRSSRLGSVRMVAAAVALVAGGITLGALFSGHFWSNTHSTAVGEIRRIALSDGSIVELNTHSKVRVDFQADRRDVHLSQGEAFFTVAKHRDRPFRVLSDAAHIRAIGTQFSVYQRPAGTVVTVLEGKVVVSPTAVPELSPSPDVAVIPLSAGQQAIVDSGPVKKTAVAKTSRVDAARAMAWRQHRLIFDNQPLSVVIDEFNRYNRQQLMVKDAELAAQGISGVFDPAKPEGLILFLSKKGGVQVTERSDETLVLSR